MGDDGILDIGAKTLYEAANSGYTWGIAVDRVLISNSTPNVDLGGGYSARVAIGQAADGSLILIFANDRGFYPSGITYSELASLMYEYGAVSAAAIRAEGAFYVDGVGQLGSKSENGFSLIVKGGAN
jgi:exopolysaccharide biosynthesis protein